METIALQVSRKTDLVDESFETGTAGDADLLCVLDPDQFSYAIRDRSREKMLVLRDYRILPGNNFTLNGNFFRHVLEQDEILSSFKPEKTILAVHPSCSILIPAPLFSKEDAKDVLELSCHLDENSRVYDDRMRLVDSHHVYAVPENLLKETGDYFREALLFHAGTAFIESQLMLNKHQQQPVMSVNVRMHYLDVMVSTGSELLFYNSFIYQTTEDFIYYILYCMEQLQLNPDQTEVRFYGEVEKTSASWMLGRKYIRNVSLGALPESTGFSYVFGRIAPHHHYVLFSQHLCVS